MVTLIQILLWAICLGIARYEAYRFDVLQKGINHTAWATAYIFLCIIAGYATHNWLVFIAGVCLHLPLFTTALNYWRRPRRPIFYTNWAANGGSKLDEVWKNAYPVVFFITSAAYVALQFFIYDKT
jgi:hypothetical protein